jgi:hypothetical protein
MAQRNIWPIWRRFGRVDKFDFQLRGISQIQETCWIPSLFLRGLIALYVVLCTVINPIFD